MDLPRIEPSALPPKIKDFLTSYHKDCPEGRECLPCNSICCSRGGFAVLENMLMIYKAYRECRLMREDYVFTPGLDFADFAFKYFDVYTYDTGKWFWKKDIVFFHMKHLSCNGNLVSIPGIGGYWDTRNKLFNDNPWLSHGCIFLNRKLDETAEDHDSGRHCILHTELSTSHLTAKPIDCMFFSCLSPGEYKIPEQEETERWFRLLAVNYPNSVERFSALLKDADDTEDADN